MAANWLEQVGHGSQLVSACGSRLLYKTSCKFL